MPWLGLFLLYNIPLFTSLPGACGYHSYGNQDSMACDEALDPCSTVSVQSLLVLQCDNEFCSFGDARLTEKAH